MGNTLTLRPIPRRIHNTESGISSYFQYGASQITGWRFTQEDRYICMPKFHEDYSLFAVYDGHGGGQAVQYLYRYLHINIKEELKRSEDPQLALYLGFLTTDLSLRNITKEELKVIEDDLDLEFEVPDQAERRHVLFKSCNALRDSCGWSENNSAAAASAPSTSQEVSKIDLTAHQDLRAEIASVCYNELKSVKFLTQDEMEVDESDEEYDPDRDNISLNYFGGETLDEDEEDDEESSEDEEYVETNEVSAPSGSEESGDKESSENKETVEDQTLVEKSKPSEELSEKKKDSESDANMLSSHKNAEQPQDCKEETKKTEQVISETPVSGCSKEEPSKFVDFIEPESKFCEATGSTATVVLLNDKYIYIANVGDSRAIGYMDGQAVDLTIDHKPTIKEEKRRIYNAGGFVKDQRVSGILDMSRTFGDFQFKKKNVAEPFQMLSCEPSIKTIEITDKLEFLIIASDGIWNVLNSEEVVQYVKNGLNMKLDLQDICGEMFELILPTSSTDDGSGCDNLTAILIVFNKEGRYSNNSICTKESFTYNYTPWNSGEKVKDTRETSVLKRASPHHDTEKSSSEEHAGDHLPTTDDSVPLEPIPSSENKDCGHPYKRFKVHHSNEHYRQLDPRKPYYSNYENSQACPINYSSDNKSEPVNVEVSKYAKTPCVTEQFLNSFQDMRNFLETTLERIRVVHSGLRATINDLDVKLSGFLKNPEFAQQFGEHSCFNRLNSIQEPTNNVFQLNPYLNIYQPDDFYKSITGYEENAPIHGEMQPIVEDFHQRNIYASNVKPSTSVSREIPLVDLTIDEEVATGGVGGSTGVVYNEASDALNGDTAKEEEQVEEEDT